jgi:serine/threonine protein kinase
MQNVAHLDISLENFLLFDNGITKVCDFGLAVEVPFTFRMLKECATYMLLAQTTIFSHPPFPSPFPVVSPFLPSPPLPPSSGVAGAAARPSTLRFSAFPKPAIAVVHPRAASSSVFWLALVVAEQPFVAAKQPDDVVFARAERPARP